MTRESTSLTRRSMAGVRRGWVLGLTIVSVVVVLVASGADDADSGPSTAVDVIKVLIGVLFVVMASGQWRKRPKPELEPEMPKWMAAIDRFSAGSRSVWVRCCRVRTRRTWRRRWRRRRRSPGRA